MNPEVQAALVSGVFLLLVALVPILLAQSRRLRSVQNQVRNGHETNLRDDIDYLHATVVNGFIDVNRRVDNIATDLAWERRERIDLAERLTGVRPLG